MDPASLLSSLEPVSLIFGVVTMGLAHFSHDAEIRYDAGCWGTTAWYRCHRENFGAIRTDAYLAAVKSGHNISAPLNKPVPPAPAIPGKPRSRLH